MNTYAIIYSSVDGKYALLKIGTTLWSQWQNSIKVCLIKGLIHSHNKSFMTKDIDSLINSVKKSNTTVLYTEFKAESLPDYNQFIKLYHEVFL